MIRCDAQVQDHWFIPEGADPTKGDVTEVMNHDTGDMRHEPR